MIEYDSDAKELEWMMAAVGGGFNPQEEDGTEKEAPPSVMGQPEFRDSTSEIKVLGEAVLLGIPSMSKSSERRCPRRTPPGLCPRLRSPYSE